MSFDSSRFLNLSKASAHNLAEANSLVFRLVSVDGENFLGYPEDQRDDRVCVEIERGKIVKATIH